jgi:hypothetical protein
MSLAHALALLLLLVASSIHAIPSGFQEVYVGSPPRNTNFQDDNNVLDIEPLPNGNALVVTRKGIIYISNMNENNFQIRTYLDISQNVFAEGA